MRTARLAVALALALSAPAIGQTYSSSSAFLAALGGPPTVEGFESRALGAAVPNGTVINALTFSGMSGPGGVTSNIYAYFGTQALCGEKDNLPGNSASDFFYPGEAVVVTFSQPVMAAGAFFNIVADPVLTNYCSLQAGGTTAFTGGAVPDIGSFFFAGVISATPFTQITIAVGSNAPSGWNLDDITYLEGGVTCYPDCDANGTLNVNDYICFQTKFALGDPYADCDANGVRNVNDYICFQTKFALGC